MAGVDSSRDLDSSLDDPGSIFPIHEGLSVRTEQTFPEDAFGRNWTRIESDSERRRQGRSWPPPPAFVTGDRQSPRWTRDTILPSVSSSRAHWPSEAEDARAWHARLHASRDHEEARVSQTNWIQPEVAVDDYFESHSRPRPRTSYEFHEPLQWYDYDSNGRTRSHAGPPQHKLTTFSGANNRSTQFSSHTAYDMRDPAPPFEDPDTTQNTWMADLERRHDQVGGSPARHAPKNSNLLRVLQIAASTQELLYNLEGPQESRRERLLKVQRSSYQILNQIHDLANFADSPLPVPGVPPASNYQPVTNQSSSSLGPDDVIARLHQSNPEAAEQAARDMAAIRARTHGNIPKPPAADKGKEREGGGNDEG